MLLKTLTLINYKNFENKTFDFDSKVNCFVGLNGVGKSNILDSIYHLSYGKSYFNPIPSQNIKHGEEYFMINGVYSNNDNEENIVISLKKGVKKIIKRNNKLYKKFSNHIGLIPLVIISPTDRNLIIEGSETRRKFIDSIISQVDKDYLTSIITYSKILSQRNSLLKYFAKNNSYESNTIDVYDIQLSDLSKRIHASRKEFMSDFVPIFKKRYQSISENNEEVDILYKSDLNDSDHLELLKKAIEKDLVLQYTTKGTHKDDLVFLKNDFSIKKFGSQGQQKSFLISLKLAQFDFLEKQNNSPILLLDDIFDKLDDNRVKQIVNLVNEEKFKQIFISDTNKKRTESTIKSVNKSYKIFEL
tara:strand:- start:303 stop:1379 length:1077 start_codon:yes stop_codon:yes gene_type:complete